MKRMLMISVFSMVAAAGTASADPVTSDDLLKAQDNSKEWLTYGRDYRNWRFSPQLSEITPDNASKLSPVWAMSTGGQFGGLEATPLFRDGVLYFTADYARTFAVDAKSGNILWHYEPEYGDGFNAYAVLRACQPRRGARGRSRPCRPARCAACRAEPRRRQGRLGHSDRRLEARRDDEFVAARRKGSRHHPVYPKAANMAFAAISSHTT